MLDLKHYSDLLDKLYQGPFEANPFHSFLDELRAALQLSFAALILRHPQNLDQGLLFMSSPTLPPSNIDAPPNAPPNIYTGYYYAFDPIANLPLGKVVTLDEITDLEEFEKTEFYKMCNEPNDIHFIAGIDLRDDQGHRFSLRLCRPRALRNFTAAERGFIEMLSSHVRRAIASSITLVQFDAERQFYARAISGRALAIVILDEGGRILRSNGAADRALRDRDGIARVHDQLHIANSPLNDSLQRHIRVALEAQRSGATVPLQAILVPRPSGKPDYELVLNAIPVDRQFAPDNSPHLIVFISDPAQKAEISTQALINLYHLTATQAALVTLLAEGKPLEDVAQALNIKTTTARAHLRSIFAKTGVTQQSKLVSLVLKSLASVFP
jgi:DNA-binding CsgD family transcriptional regulator/GAF domain-containing protein